MIIVIVSAWFYASQLTTEFTELKKIQIQVLDAASYTLEGLDAQLPAE